MKWEDSIDSAIRLRFAMNDPSAVISIEYMDTKRIDPNQTRLDALKSLYIKKYKGKHFDLIIASNTDAFNFLLKNRDEIFPGTPVVFCGVVNFDDKMLDGKRGFTGVVEAYDVAGTLALMLHLHPHTQHIAVVTDLTTTGKANRNVLDRTISNFKGNVSFEFLDNLSADELRSRVATLANNSLILLMTFNRDRNGKVLTYEDSSELIREASPVPIYSVYDFYLGYGVVGGKMISGTSQGEQAADLALRVLQGEPAEKIPVVKKSFNYYMFDMFELNRFGIHLTSLPNDSVIINTPFHSRAKLIGLNLSGLNLANVNLSRAEMQESNMNRTNLSGANLEGASMCKAWLIKANLTGSNMEEADICESNISGASLNGAILVGSDLIGSNLTAADITGANLEQARINQTKLLGVILDNANLAAVNLSRSDLTGAHIAGAYLRRARIRDAILVGANLTRADLIGATLINSTISMADLSGADISESRCSGANFFGSRFIKSNLVFANLTHTNLSTADLSGSDLNTSGLDGSNLSKTNLSGANLENAMIDQARLVGAKLNGANLKGARIGQLRPIRFQSDPGRSYRCLA